MALPQVNLLLLMHGFHQGQSTVSNLITEHKPDLFLLQEHWLTPANLHLFDTHFANYFSIGSSAMSPLWWYYYFNKKQSTSSHSYCTL